MWNVQCAFFCMLPRHFFFFCVWFFFCAGKKNPENYFMRMSFVWMWIRPQTVINVEQCTTRKCRQLKPIRKNHATAIHTDRVLCVWVVFSSGSQVYIQICIAKKYDTFFQFRVIRHNFKAFFHFVNSMPHNIFYLPQLYKLFILQIWKSTFGLLRLVYVFNQPV